MHRTCPDRHVLFALGPFPGWLFRLLCHSSVVAASLFAVPNICRFCMGLVVQQLFNSNRGLYSLHVTVFACRFEATSSEMGIYVEPRGLPADMCLKLQLLQGGICGDVT